MISQFFIFILMIDAFWIACGLARRKNMWRWIVLYWVMLTMKNYVDYIGLP